MRGGIGKPLGKRPLGNQRRWEDDVTMSTRLIGFLDDRCIELAVFGISGVEPSGSATTVLVSKMDLSEIGCEVGRWMELAQDHVQWQDLVLAVLYLRFLIK
jgi:hypothetical protein